MDDSIELSADIFVNSSFDQIQLTEFIIRVTNGERKNTVMIKVSVGHSEITVQKNVRSKHVLKNEKIEFMQFRHYLEIDGSDLNEQVALVSKLLEAFWKENIPAVAVCEYEDLLPEKGGYSIIQRWQKK